MVAILHALVAVRLVEVCLVSGPWPFSTLGEENTACQTLVMILSSGYFLFDFVWCIYMGTEGIMMLLHHIVSLLSLLYGLYLGCSGSEITSTLWGSELTNPFLQTRWFLREQKLYQTTFAKINDIIFLSLFAFVRVGIGSSLAYLLYLAEKPVTGIKVGGFSFYFISLLWMTQIIKFAIKRFGKKKIT